MFSPDDIRQALTACTSLCQCKDCEETREESYTLLAAWLNARLFGKVTQERKEAMRKCSICKVNLQGYTWQPELGEHSFYLPGNHIRGFMTVPVCDPCIEKIKQGETVLFVYKNQEYKANLKSLEKIETPKEEGEDPIYPDFESAWPALERGERVRIEMEPFQIDPWLVQKALDLQSQERLDEWKRQQHGETER